MRSPDFMPVLTRTWYEAMNGMVELEAVHYAYPDGTRALEGVSFSVREGEHVAVVGGNGAGKSTLLMQLNGYLMPSRGAVRVGGVLLGPETAVMIRRAVGVVFQDPDDQLFMPTVGEDVAFGPLHAGLPAAEVEARVVAALERPGTAHLRGRPPYRLSAGEKRAAAIATVLALEPAVLVMDEPSSHLDPRARRRLIGLLQSIGHTCLIATHDLELAVEVCRRVIVLGGGRVAADGPVEDVLRDEPLLSANGLERPHILQHRHPHR